MPEKVLRVIWDSDLGEVVKIEGLDKFNSTELMDIRQDLIVGLEKAAIRRGGNVSQEMKDRAGWK